MTASAEMIITNGRVLSMNPDQPEAEAIAIAGGRILAVGTSVNRKQYHRYLAHQGEPSLRSLRRICDYFWPRGA